MVEMNMRFFLVVLLWGVACGSLVGGVVGYFLRARRNHGA